MKQVVYYLKHDNREYYWGTTPSELLPDPNEFFDNPAIVEGQEFQLLAITIGDNGTRQGCRVLDTAVLVEADGFYQWR